MQLRLRPELWNARFHKGNHHEVLIQMSTDQTLIVIDVAFQLKGGGLDFLVAARGSQRLVFNLMA